MPELNDLNEDSPAKLSRRNVVVGTAWALPVVMGVGAASAVAASTVLTVTLTAEASPGGSNKTNLSCTVGVGSSPGTGDASLGTISPGSWAKWSPESASITTGSAVFAQKNAKQLPTSTTNTYTFQVTAGGVTKTATFVFSAYGTQTVTLS